MGIIIIEFGTCIIYIIVIIVIITIIIKTIIIYIKYASI